MKAVVAIVACPTYELAPLEKALDETLALVGGAAAFFKRGERVLIKPNLLTTAGPEEAVTTHPNFVRAVVRILKRSGLSLAIGDIPGEHRLEANVERVYVASGMRQVASAEGVELLKTQKFIEEDGVIFASWVREFDHIVSLPKFKTHALTTLTGAVKNVFGLTPRLYRVSLHKRYIETGEFARMLLDVYLKCKPTLSFVDGILAMEGNGPASAGEPKKVGLIAASSDAVALDSVLARVMGLEAEDIPTNRQARLRGLGACRPDEIELRGDPLDDFLKTGFALPPTNMLERLPNGLIRFLLEKYARSRPRVDRNACDGCRICVENCPLAAIGIRDKKARIDYSMCVDCFCCLEVCPKGAMRMKSGPLLGIVKFLKRLAKELLVWLKPAR